MSESLPPDWSQSRVSTYLAARRSLFSEPLPPRNEKQQKRKRELPTTFQESKTQFPKAAANVLPGKEQYALRICIKHNFVCPYRRKSTLFISRIYWEKCRRKGRCFLPLGHKSSTKRQRFQSTPLESMKPFDWDSLSTGILKEGTCLFAANLHELKVQMANEVKEKLTKKLTEKTQAAFETIHK